jgi:hypothetical protein
MRPTVLKTFSVVFIMTIFVLGPANATKGRSFEECQRLAKERGIPIKRAHPDRYVMLKGFGEKTKPKGFMAQCMSGMPM